MNKETTPLTRDDILEIDIRLAKVYLVVELIKIPEFVQLWSKARSDATRVMAQFKAEMESIFAKSPPEASELNRLKNRVNNYLNTDVC